MPLVIGAALALFCIAILAYPLLKSRSGGQRVRPAPDVSLGSQELEAVYQNIRTLRLDYQMGNVPESSFREQMNDYRLQAALALRRGTEAVDGDAGQLLEHEVLLARFALNGAGGGVAFCPRCGADLDEEASECQRCAASPGRQSPELP